MQVRPPRALPPWRGDKLEWQWNGKFRQASGGRLAPSASVQPVELADIPDNVSESRRRRAAFRVITDERPAVVLDNRPLSELLRPRVDPAGPVPCRR